MSGLLPLSPLQGPSSQDPCQRPTAPAPCTPACDLQATPSPVATEGRQSAPCRGSASPEWSPSTLGSPKAQSPAPSGGLCAEHLPGTEPQPPPMAACGIGRSPGPSPHGPQQPPQLWLRWGRPCPSQMLLPNPRAAAQPSPRPTPRAPTDSRDPPPTHPPGAAASYLELLWTHQPSTRVAPGRSAGRVRMPQGLCSQEWARSGDKCAVEVAGSIPRGKGLQREEGFSRSQNRGQS